MGTIDKAMFY